MKLLVGYNGSEVSKAALALAAKHAGAFGANVVVITSMGGGRKESREMITRAADELDKAKAFIESLGASCETRQVARGLSPAEDIVRFADEEGVDQIFVGVEKRSKTQKIIMGSTAQYVILKANCPVITVNDVLDSPPF